MLYNPSPRRVPTGEPNDFRRPDRLAAPRSGRSGNSNLGAPASPPAQGQWLGQGRFPDAPHGRTPGQRRTRALPLPHCRIVVVRGGPASLHELPPRHLCCSQRQPDQHARTHGRRPGHHAEAREHRLGLGGSAQHFRGVHDEPNGPRRGGARLRGGGRLRRHRGSHGEVQGRIRGRLPHQRGGHRGIPRSARDPSRRPRIAPVVPREREARLRPGVGVGGH
mmetsp:Transcript_14234/g.41768  ORF Transcript_14234/g.41768 Transcript_14234/m.41768 type:complete len:221 (-) Transcript_14234:1111-1773(-)